MKQILKIMMAISLNRPILLIDEPFVYLSNENKKIIGDILKKISLNKCLFLTSQNELSEIGTPHDVIILGKK